MRFQQSHTLISFLHILSFPLGKNSKIVNVEDVKGATQRAPTSEAEEGIRPAVALGALHLLLFNLFSCDLFAGCVVGGGAGRCPEQRPLVATAFSSAACRVGEPPLGL